MLKRTTFMIVNLLFIVTGTSSFALTGRSTFSKIVEDAYLSPTKTAQAKLLPYDKKESTTSGDSAGDVGNSRSTDSEVFPTRGFSVLNTQKGFLPERKITRFKSGTPVKIFTTTMIPNSRRPPKTATDTLSFVNKTSIGQNMTQYIDQRNLQEKVDPYKNDPKENNNIDYLVNQTVDNRTVAATSASTTENISDLVDELNQKLNSLVTLRAKKMTVSDNSHHNKSSKRRLEDLAAEIKQQLKSLIPLESSKEQPFANEDDKPQGEPYQKRSHFSSSTTTTVFKDFLPKFPIVKRVHNQATTRRTPSRPKPSTTPKVILPSHKIKIKQEWTKLPSLTSESEINSKDYIKAKRTRSQINKRSLSFRDAVFDKIEETKNQQTQIQHNSSINDKSGDLESFELVELSYDKVGEPLSRKRLMRSEKVAENRSFFKEGQNFFDNNINSYDNNNNNKTKTKITKYEEETVDKKDDDSKKGPNGSEIEKNKKGKQRSIQASDSFLSAPHGIIDNDGVEGPFDNSDYRFFGNDLSNTLPVGEGQKQVLRLFNDQQRKSFGPVEAKENDEMKEKVKNIMDIDNAQLLKDAKYVTSQHTQVTYHLPPPMPVEPFAHHGDAWLSSPDSEASLNPDGDEEQIMGRNDLLKIPKQQALTSKKSVNNLVLNVYKEPLDDDDIESPNHHDVRGADRLNTLPAEDSLPLHPRISHPPSITSFSKNYPNLDGPAMDSLQYDSIHDIQKLVNKVFTAEERNDKYRYGDFLQQHKRMLLQKHKCLCPDDVIEALTDLQKFGRDIVDTAATIKKEDNQDAEATGNTLGNSTSAVVARKSFKSIIRKNRNVTSKSAGQLHGRINTKYNINNIGKRGGNTNNNNIQNRTTPRLKNTLIQQVIKKIRQKRRSIQTVIQFAKATKEEGCLKYAGRCRTIGLVIDRLRRDVIILVRKNILQGKKQKV